MNKRFTFGLSVCLVAMLAVGAMTALAADRPGGLPSDLPEFPGAGEGAGGNLLACIPQGIGLPEELIAKLRDMGLEDCEAGQSPINIPPQIAEMLVCVPPDLELGANLPFELDLEALVEQMGLEFCTGDTKAIKISEEMQEKFNCVPQEFIDRLPFGLTADDIDFGTLHICAEGESPFTITLPEEPPAWLVCIPANWDELGLPIDAIPDTWDLPTCGPNDSPIAVPEALVGNLKCIPPKLAELPITLPPELAGLPVCVEGERPFDIVLPEAPDGGGEWVFPDLPETDENEWINLMAQKGYISGVGNGMLGTGMEFTRGQSLVLLLRGAANDPSFQPFAANSTSFSDVDGWVAPWAADAKARGVAAGYPDGTFRPNQSLTVEEVLALCSNIGGLNPPAGGDTWSEKYFRAVEKGYGIYIDESLAKMGLDRETALQILGVCIEMEPVQ